MQIFSSPSSNICHVVPCLQHLLLCCLGTCSFLNHHSYDALKGAVVKLPKSLVKASTDMLLASTERLHRDLPLGSSTVFHTRCFKLMSALSAAAVVESCFAQERQFITGLTLYKAWSVLQYTMYSETWVHQLQRPEVAAIRLACPNYNTACVKGWHRASAPEPECTV